MINEVIIIFLIKIQVQIYLSEYLKFFKSK